MYKIVRFYLKNNDRRTIKFVETLDEAKKYCSDPETSSTTCRKKAGKARTERFGPWFDGFDKA